MIPSNTGFFFLELKFVDSSFLTHITYIVLQSQEWDF